MTDRMGCGEGGQLESGGFRHTKTQNWSEGLGLGAKGGGQN